MRNLLTVFGSIALIFLFGGAWSLIGGIVLPGAAQFTISGAILMGAVLISFAIIQDKGTLTPK